MYKVWRSKQTSGFYGTRVKVGMYMGETNPDKQCPNCGRRETAAHLMLCPDDDRTQLLIENVDELSKWLDKDGKTDPDLTYWIPKYILMRGDKPFLKMGYMSTKLKSLAESQDRIGWKNFTEGHISTHFLRDSDISPCNVKRLPQWDRLDQTIYHKDPASYTFPVDISKHFPIRQTSGISPQ
jgi:hypothetical protein